MPAAGAQASIRPAPPGGDDQHGQLDRIGHGGDVRVAVQAQDLIGFRIDRIDRAGICAHRVEQVADYAIDQLAGVALAPMMATPLGVKNGARDAERGRRRGHGQLRC